MKLFPLYAALALLCMEANAQSTVVTASGSSSSASTVVDWTIGDVINETFVKNGLIVAAANSGATALFIVTGDIKEEKQGPSVYPVPFETEFFIEALEPDATLDFNLFDGSGKSIKPSFTLEGSVYRVHADEISSGLYILVVKQQNSETSHVFKIIKK